LIISARLESIRRDKRRFAPIRCCRDRKLGERAAFHHENNGHFTSNVSSRGSDETILRGHETIFRF
jgi:hypothetical protein